MRHKEPAKEEIQQGSEVGDRIDQTMRCPAAHLAERMIADGLEDWEVAIGFLFAAFMVIEKMEDRIMRVETARNIQNMCQRMVFLTMETAVAERQEEQARDQQIAAADDLMDP